MAREPKMAVGAVESAQPQLTFSTLPSCQTTIHGRQFSAMTANYTDDQLLTLDPQLQAIFKQRGAPRLAIPTLKNIKYVRQGFAAATARFNASKFASTALAQASSKVKCEREQDHTIPVRGGRNIQARIYTPSSGVDSEEQRPNRQTHAKRPVLVFMHAGGWFAGGLDTEAFLCRLFCRTFGLLVVNVAYGLHPDVGFGVPQTDCFDTLLWIVTNERDLGADLEAGFVLGGNSGGCTWASVAAHLWQEERERRRGAIEEAALPPITGSFFLAPIFSNEHETKEGKIAARYDFATQYRSWWQCKEAPMMNDEMRMSIANLITFDFKSRLLSPFMFTNHAGTGATYIAVCGIDPWRDGGILYANELKRDDIKTRVDVYPGLPHCWWTTFPQIDATKRWLQQSIDGMAWTLKNGTKDLPDFPPVARL